MCTFFSGAVLRTTHMTGIVTDIGIILGHMARKESKAEVWKLKLFLPIYFGFMFGGFVGCYSYSLFAEKAIALSSTFTLSLAFIHWQQEKLKKMRNYFFRMCCGKAYYEEHFEMVPVADEEKHEMISKACPASPSSSEILNDRL
jgi:hypothetical protein